MTGRRFELLVNGEKYHIYNRSIASEQIFSKSSLLKRALSLIEYYRFPQKLRFSYYRRLPSDQKLEYTQWYKSQEPMVAIHAFGLMPSHFHLLLEQSKDSGIEKFMSITQNSFGKFYNLVNKRHGSVFQKPFKSKRIATDEEFVHVSRYIHLNPVTSYLIELDELDLYPWNSFRYYVNKENDLVETEYTLALAGSRLKYRRFVRDQSEYQRKLEGIKHLILE